LLRNDDDEEDLVGEKKRGQEEDKEEVEEQEDYDGEYEEADKERTKRLRLQKRWSLNGV
jgi:hypothetical protein